MSRIYHIVLFLIFLSATSVLGQNSMGNRAPRVFLNDEETHYIKMSTYIQIWGRVNQNNPGSTVFGRPEDVTTDLSIRRFRWGLSIQPADKLYAYFNLGVNNIRYISPRGTSIELLDAHAEYTFSKHLTIGGGKSAWDGLSRYTSPSSSKQMSYDLAFVALPTLNATDDLIRKLGIYAKGKIGNIDYRIILAKPFSPQNSSSFRPEPSEGIAELTDVVQAAQTSAYLKYEFWEKESNKSPFMVGTYHGSRKVLNLGAGFLYQPDALWSLDQTDTLLHDMALFATDFFMELPLNKQKNTALTTYTALFSYDFGPNYIRPLGANNPMNGVIPEEASFNGSGNTFPISGTGTTSFTQVGYLFPKMGSSKSLGQLQSYFTIQYSNFERLDNPMIFYDLGLSWLLNGHLSKFTFNMQNRPIYFDTPEGLTVEDRKLMFVLQYEVRLE